MKNYTKRFENAITKLYTAFHNDTLYAYSCEACAVGNIVGNGDWSGGVVDGRHEPVRCLGSFNDYTGIELMNIEVLFLKAHSGNIFLNPKEQNFKGLCAVVEYLAELDNIPNPMDYKSLFKERNDKKLEEVFK